MNGNFYATIAARLAGREEKPFLTIPGGRSWTFAELLTVSGRMAEALLAEGARPGDRIAAQVEKSAETVALYLACLRAGFVYLPLNTAYTPQEIAYFLADATPAIFVCDPGYNSGALVCRALTLSADGHGTLIDAAGAIAAKPAIEPRRGDDLAAILYTSGTTGRSKGAMITHDNLASNAMALSDIWGLRADDVLIHVLPVFHIHGLFVALNTALLNAMEVIFLDGFDVAEVRSALPGATLMMGVPTHYARLLSDPAFNRDDCKSMRVFISGSAPLSTATFEEFEARAGQRILERYGMSEAGMIASNPLAGPRIAATVGYPLPGVEVRVTGGGECLPPNAPGDIEVKGPNVFKGYWNMPEKTAEALAADGWFTTGDVGFLSEDGRLSLSGRSKDLIIVGGFNVYPKEIEDVLDAAPEIAESAVIGAPHPDMGEGVVAILVSAANAAAGPPLTDRQLIALVAGLAKFKWPRRFFWVDALPRNAMGKVQKQALRERFAGVFST